MSTAGAIRSETRATREGELGIAPHIGNAIGKRLLQQRKGWFGLRADSGQGEGGVVPDKTAFTGHRQADEPGNRLCRTNDDECFDSVAPHPVEKVTANYPFGLSRNIPARSTISGTASSCR